MKNLNLEAFIYLATNFSFLLSSPLLLLLLPLSVAHISSENKKEREGMFALSLSFEYSNNEHVALFSSFNHPSERSFAEREREEKREEIRKSHTTPEIYIFSVSLQRQNRRILCAVSWTRAHSCVDFQSKRSDLLSDGCERATLIICCDRTKVYYY